MKILDSGGDSSSDFSSALVSGEYDEFGDVTLKANHTNDYFQLKQPFSNHQQVLMHHHSTRRQRNDIFPIDEEWKLMTPSSNGNLLDNVGSTVGHHASLVGVRQNTSSPLPNIGTGGAQLREGGTLVGQRINYMDSGYSEEDPEQQQHITSCLMRTPSGSVYIPPTKIKNMTIDSRLEYRFPPAQSPSFSPKRECLKKSERSSLGYITGPHGGNRSVLRLPGGGRYLSASRSLLRKNISMQMSWRSTAIFLIVLTLALSCALIYITASSFLPVNYGTAKVCAVVLDTHSKDLSDSENFPHISNANGITSSATAADDDYIADYNTNAFRGLQPRNSPPDSTSFNEISLDRRIRHHVVPYGYWNIQFYQADPSYVTFDLRIPKGTSVGFYARRNALPTHTQHDFMDVINEASLADKTKSEEAASQTRFVDKRLDFYMTEGHWFVSMYNDNGDDLEIVLQITLADDLTVACPRGCFGRGQCVLGRCQCLNGYDGPDCSLSVCPLLCNGHGDYDGGSCKCFKGWKGPECSLRQDECQVPDCNGHGQCSEGTCVCMHGYTGEFCERVDCPDSNCSGNGFCVKGMCHCKKGWRGVTCSNLDDDARNCLPSCNNNGKFNIETQSCVCKFGWTGSECQSKQCNMDCGQNGRCEDSICKCDNGWQGHRCEYRTCDKRCQQHGQCKNGTCLCVTGWNGRYCTLNGCPDSCSNNGRCVIQNDATEDEHDEWKCVCSHGWDGPNCAIRLEQLCEDGIDNDADGLIDCEDPECCETSNVCRRSSQLCITVPQPIEILMQRQPPAATASFFQKTRFIIEEGSLQRYAKNTAFNESRAAVIRGRVVTEGGRGLVGVRVTHSKMQSEGYTMTQEDGWFDFMVNGGGSVTLHFVKKPFPPQIRNLFTPWNEVLIIDPIIMSMKEKSNFLLNLNNDNDDINGSGGVCSSHDYELMKPVVLATWKLGTQSAYNSSDDRLSTIVPESRVLRETILIPGSNRLRLVYHSSRAKGYLSTIEFQLTPSTIPAPLTQVLLRITIEGVLFEKTFEANANLKYTYSWRRINIYRQSVYGTTTAVIKVGYVYSDCSRTIWDIQTTKISGQDMRISDIGGWDFNIHHRYNHLDGIVYKGDGTNIFLKARPKLLEPTMGDGQQRLEPCLEIKGCGNGYAKNQRLLLPVALATSSDGSLFVGDFNLIRKIEPDNTVRTVLRLNSSQVADRYYVAVDPNDNSLYISDPEKYQIIRLKRTDRDNSLALEGNLEVVVGSGIRCLLGDADDCGDGGPARDARLTYPKGIAVSADNRLYFADGTNIRYVDPDGTASTLIGSHVHRQYWKPLPCEGTLPVQEVNLRWPTALTINPLDNTLYFIDDNMVMKITVDSRIQVVAGRPLHCYRPQVSTHYMNFATHVTLVSPQSVAFSPQGELYIAESDARRINRVIIVRTDGRLEHVAGRDSICNCNDPTCPCFNDKEIIATDSVFSSISSISVSADNSLHICDQGNRQIQTVRIRVPDISKSQQYEVFSPETQEVYFFNRFGLHTQTQNVITGSIIYKFAYSVSTSNGRLAEILDSNGDKITIIRDYSGKVNALVNTQHQRFNVQLDRKRMLTSLVGPNNESVEFDYYRSSQLIKSRSGSDENVLAYNYDSNGRLESTVLTTGEFIQLNSDIDIRGAVVNISRNGINTHSLLIRPNLVYMTSATGENEVIEMKSDRSFVKQSKWQHVISLDTSPYKLLASDTSGLSESFPIPSRVTVNVGDDVISKFEWRYYTGNNDGSDQKIGKTLFVNNNKLLNVELNRKYNKQTIILHKNTGGFINISEATNFVRFGSHPSFYDYVQCEKNNLGLITKWQWGNMVEKYEYDETNRLQHVILTNGGSLRYIYDKEPSMAPVKMVIPTGGSFSFVRDHQDALISIITPRGHKYGFSKQNSFGHVRYMYERPWSTSFYELQYDVDGLILAKVFPDKSGKVIYNYDESKKLKSILGGHVNVQYHYIIGTALVGSIEVSDMENDFDLKTECKYHYGLLKHIGQSFLMDKPLFSNVVVHYLYDGNGRISSTTTQVGTASKLDAIITQFDSELGYLNVIDEIRIKRQSQGQVAMEDASKRYKRIKEYDTHGRISSIKLILNQVEKFQIVATYTDRLKSLRVDIEGHNSEMEEFKYNANGQLESVNNSHEDTWVYTYDDNGNVIGRYEFNRQLTLGYDNGDRVVVVDGKQYIKYDTRGNVASLGDQLFMYNILGQMTRAIRKNSFNIQFFYDDLGRLLGKKDHRGNVVQYIYSNPYHKFQVTYVHYPKAGTTHKLIYDEKGYFISMKTSETQYYIGTDHQGSPIAVFDQWGKLVKDILRTPFGRVITDSNPTLDIILGFYGGLFDSYTDLLHINGRIYDPIMGQWMTPSLDKMDEKMISPFQLFTYRFKNNDPLNGEKNNYMTDIQSWLHLYGFDLPKIRGSTYILDTLSSPTIEHNNHLNSHSQFSINTGLDRLYERFLGIFDALNLYDSKIDVIYPDLAHKRRLVPSAFGNGILLSHKRGVDERKMIVKVTLVNRNSVGQDDVVRSVFMSVLNASMLLSASFSGAEEFYFLKTDEAAYRSDMNQLQRLSGSYNITQNSLRPKGSIVCATVSTQHASSTICLLYGLDERQATRHLIHQQRKSAVDDAWAQEQALASTQFVTRFNWSPTERNQLLRFGKVRGYSAIEINSVRKYPSLGGQSSNIMFLTESEAKSWRSG